MIVVEKGVSHSNWNSLNNETLTRMELCANVINYYKKKRFCSAKSILVYFVYIWNQPYNPPSEQLNEEKLWYQDFSMSPI